MSLARRHVTRGVAAGIGVGSSHDGHNHLHDNGSSIRLEMGKYASGGIFSEQRHRSPKGERPTAGRVFRLPAAENGVALQNLAIPLSCD